MLTCDLVHVKKAKINTAYKVVFSDSIGFSVGDLISVLENKRVTEAYSHPLTKDVIRAGSGIHSGDKCKIKVKNNTTGKVFNEIIGGLYISEDLS